MQNCYILSNDGASDLIRFKRCQNHEHVAQEVLRLRPDADNSYQPDNTHLVGESVAGANVRRRR